MCTRENNYNNHRLIYSLLIVNSSFSSSLHHTLRERAGYGGYDYGTHYGNNYYAYLENLRRTNPAAYSEWYHKYYAGQHQHIARGVSNYPEDRASVHSGRSSCDDRCAALKSPLRATKNYHLKCTLKRSRFIRLLPLYAGSYNVRCMLDFAPSQMHVSVRRTKRCTFLISDTPDGPGVCGSAVRLGPI